MSIDSMFRVPVSAAPSRAGRRMWALSGPWRRVSFVAADAALIATAYILAHLIRFEGAIPSVERVTMWHSLPLIVLPMGIALAVFGQYRRLGPWSGTGELTRLVSALTVGALAGATLIFLAGVRGHSRLVFVAFYPLAVVGVSAARLQMSRLRGVQLEDLLRRRALPPDLALSSAYLGGRRVMITGAGGSIGGELCRQVCRSNPAAVILVDRVENALYDIDLEIGECFPEVTRIVQLADIRSLPRMQEIFEKYRPEIVFHAAAFKHVPLMESHAGEVVLNNIVGTASLARMALAHGIRDFVLISSDKAVNPANVMGVSKRITELYMHHLDRGAASGRARFLAVRFGNVLGSAGSVIPRLRRQIEQGGPVTITHPQMSRYFMTIAEAVQLVIEAAAMAEGGEVFVLDMGKPVKIMDLAKDLISLSGLEPGRDISITFTGVRAGEKLDEELWSAAEKPQPTSNPKIKAIRMNGNGLRGDLDEVIAELEVLAGQGRLPLLYERLQSVVPEFAPAPLDTPVLAAEPRSRFRVVVADDDANLRELIALALRAEQMEVWLAGDGVEAQEQIGRVSPHLVITDLRMPRLDGLSLFFRLKQNPATRHVPTLLITGHAELGEDAKDMPFEVDDFVSKPFRVAELVLRVKAILRRRYHRPGAAAVDRAAAAGE